MRSAFRFLPVLAILLVVAGDGRAQANEICGETGGSTWMHSSFVYGKIALNGFDGRKLPKITVMLYDRRRSESRITIDRSGNYCFRDTDGSGGFLVVEVEGLEVTRRSLPSGGFGPVQHRQDFEIQPVHPEKTRPPGAISAKYNHPRSEKNADRLDKAAVAESEKEFGKAVQILKEIVTDDPSDFVAWAKLGRLYFEQDKLSEAEASYQKAIAARGDYAPAMIKLGQIRLVRKQVDGAIGILEKAA